MLWTIETRLLAKHYPVASVVLCSSLTRLKKTMKASAIRVTDEIRSETHSADHGGHG